MSSGTTSPQTSPTSAPPSPTATGSAIKASKIAIIPRPQPLTAVRLAKDTAVQTANGIALTGHVDDWLVTRGREILDVVSEAVLHERYQIVEAGGLTIGNALCVQLETTLGLGATQDPQKLLAAVQRLARLKIGDVTIDFTPGQWEEIGQRAKKRGQTVKQAVQAVVDRIREEIFWRS